MIKIIKEKWAKNEAALKKAFSEMKSIEYLTYLDLVKTAFEIVYNEEERHFSAIDSVDTTKITEIDNGDYQGTLMFLIPAETYQPNEYEYLMTYVDYGSCSGCDTLQHIQSENFNYGNPPSEQQVKDLVTLCRDIMANTIRPYNHGWRYDERFDYVKEERKNDER